MNKLTITGLLLIVFGLLTDSIVPDSQLLGALLLFLPIAGLLMFIAGVIRASSSIQSVNLAILGFGSLILAVAFLFIGLGNIHASTAVFILPGVAFFLTAIVLFAARLLRLFSKHAQ